MGDHLHCLSKIITFALALYDMVVDFAGSYIVFPTQGDLEVSFVISSSPYQIMKPFTVYSPLYQGPDQLHLHCKKVSSEHFRFRVIVMFRDILNGIEKAPRRPTHQEQIPRHAPEDSSYLRLKHRSAKNASLKDARQRTNIEVRVDLDSSYFDAECLEKQAGGRCDDPLSDAAHAASRN